MTRLELVTFHLPQFQILQKYLRFKPYTRLYIFFCGRSNLLSYIRLWCGENQWQPCFLRGNSMNCCHSNSLPFHQGERWDLNPRIQLTILNQCFLLRILLCVLELSTFLYHLLKPLAYSRQRHR